MKQSRSHPESLVRSSRRWDEAKDLTRLWHCPKSPLGGRAEGRCANNRAQPGKERPQSEPAENSSTRAKGGVPDDAGQNF